MGELTGWPGGKPPVVQVRAGSPCHVQVTGLTKPHHPTQVRESEGQLTQNISRVKYRLGELEKVVPSREMAPIGYIGVIPHQRVNPRASHSGSPGCQGPKNK